MRWRPFVLALAAVWLAWPTPARGIVLDLKPGSRVAGFFVSDDGNKLVVADGPPGTNRKLTEYYRVKSAIMVVSQVDRSRLQGLTSDEPEKYLEFARELAAQAAAKQDPEARYEARRLFLIAAHLRPQHLGPEALRAMSALAERPEEARTCLALASLLDPTGDVKALKREDLKPAPLPKDLANLLPYFQKALMYYRTGDVKNAQGFASREGMDRVFAAVPGMMDQKAFLQRCKDLGKGDPPTFPDDAMRVILKAELWVIGQQSGGAAPGKKTARETNWAAILQDRADPVPPLSLETDTRDFDPRKCHYRNGQWVAP